MFIITLYPVRIYSSLKVISALSAVKFAAGMRLHKKPACRFF